MALPLELEQEADQLLHSPDENSTRYVIDPNGRFFPQWDKCMLILCYLALAVDPLFFYIPVLKLSDYCLGLDKKMETAACILRTIVDVFYFIHIALKFHTGFIRRSSQTFGKGDVEENRLAIAERYLSSTFLIDVLAIVPLPQLMVYWVTPSLMSDTPQDIGYTKKETLKFIIIVQLIPRIARIYPIQKQVKLTSGNLAETAWAAAAFNLFLYMLASHVAGALWYLISIERQQTCWREACGNNITFTGCDSKYLSCDVPRTGPNIAHTVELFNTIMKKSCELINLDDIKITDPIPLFDFGIFIDAIRSRIVESKFFFKKLLYCFWWGFRNFSSIGQNLKTSSHVPEVLFAVAISTFGLILFALLIGNIQTYLQSESVRVEEMRVKKRDAKVWMSHRLIPDEIREKVKQYLQDKWQINRGVDESGLINNLPKDLRREIKRHLCVGSLMKIPMFKQMDDQLVDAMCDRLKQVFYPKDSKILREGDQVDEMLFIIRGKCLAVTTTYGGRKGIRHTELLKEGRLCGEELMPWALDPKTTTQRLPTSTQTVYAITKLEALALEADDFKFIASHFSRCLQGTLLQHTFRVYSYQWRAWAACFIQAAWRDYSKRKREMALLEAEESSISITDTVDAAGEEGDDDEGLLLNKKAIDSSATTGGTAAFVNDLRVAPLSRRTVRSNLLTPRKPSEPNFGVKGRI